MQGTGGGAANGGGGQAGIDEPGAIGGTVDRAVPQFECTSGTNPTGKGFRRLSDSEYRNTLAEIVSRSIGPNSVMARTVLSSLSAAMAGVPLDERKSVSSSTRPSFGRLDQRVDQEHIESTFGAAEATARALTTGERIGTVVGACATDGNAANDATCLDAFIARFGSWAFRRPVPADEARFYRDRFYGAKADADPLAYADLITAFLVSPQFLYHVELGDGGADSSKLSAHELANRISYLVWETMPDEALGQAAKSGALAEPAEREVQIERLLTDPRARTGVTRFFREWLRLEDTPALNKQVGEKLFNAFAGRTSPSAMLSSAMQAEILDMAMAITFDRQGSLDDLLLDEHAYVRTQELANLYGVPLWDGQGEPPLFPDGERPGLLTRAALHATGNAQTRPILKGVFIRDVLLCDELPAPPGDVMLVEPKLSPELSTRQVVETITEQPGTNCRSCHQTYLNGLGFATENIDSLGRLRSEQILFDDNGVEQTRIPVNTEAVVRVDVEDERPVNGPKELALRVVESRKVPACLARQMARFTFAREEEVEGDGCFLERVRRAVDSGKPLRELFKQALLAPEFASRTGGQP